MIILIRVDLRKKIREICGKPIRVNPRLWPCPPRPIPLIALRLRPHFATQPVHHQFAHLAACTGAFVGAEAVMDATI